MKRTLIALSGLLVTLGLAAPAFADHRDDDDWKHDEHEWHERMEHRDKEHAKWWKHHHDERGYDDRYYNGYPAGEYRGYYQDLDPRYVPPPPRPYYPNY